MEVFHSNVNISCAKLFVSQLFYVLLASESVGFSLNLVFGANFAQPFMQTGGILIV